MGFRCWLPTGRMPRFCGKTTGEWPGPRGTKSWPARIRPASSVPVMRSRWGRWRFLQAAWIWLESDPQLHHRGSAAAFVLRRFGDRGDVGVLLEHLPQGLAQDAHAAAVDDADARESGEKGAVDELFDFARGVVDGLSNDIDLGGNVRFLPLEGD